MLMAPTSRTDPQHPGTGALLRPAAPARAVVFPYLDHEVAYRYALTHRNRRPLPHQPCNAVDHPHAGGANSIAISGHSPPPAPSQT